MAVPRRELCATDATGLLPLGAAAPHVGASREHEPRRHRGRSLRAGTRFLSPRLMAYSILLAP
jgi:hypothetical protein